MMFVKFSAGSICVTMIFRDVYADCSLDSSALTLMFYDLRWCPLVSIAAIMMSCHLC